MSELIGIAHLSKSKSLEFLPIGSFFIYNINDHNSQDARRKTQDNGSWIKNKEDRRIKKKNKSQDARLVNMLTAAKNIPQDFFNIFGLQLTLGK